MSLFVSALLDGALYGLLVLWPVLLYCAVRLLRDARKSREREKRNESVQRVCEKPLLQRNAV